MKKYWKSPEELSYGVNTSQEDKFELDHKNSVIDLFEKDIPEKTTSRRSFLKLMGFSISAATVVAGCKRPVQKAIPYLIKPEEITPGNASYYASTYFDGAEYGSILVKTRDGRPIKIEGNELSKISAGKISARIQASVLSLYDDARYKAPMISGVEADWGKADEEIIKKLTLINNKGGKIVLLSETVISPATIKVIDLFKEKYSSLEWIQYDPVSCSGMLTANKKSFGKQIIPDYHFDKADLIVGFSADFLGTWIAPVPFTRDYSKNRKLDNGKKKMSKHIQFEAGLSVTGSSADKRIPVKPSEEKVILANIYNLLAEKAGTVKVKTPKTRIDIHELVKELEMHKGNSLIVSGSNDTSTQLMVNKINYLLGNYGKTIDLDKPLNLKKGLDADMDKLVSEMEQGKVDAILFYNANPLYNFRKKDRFEKSLDKVSLKVSLSTSPDETSLIADYICPDNHYLESWNDAEPRKGSFSLAQPAIRQVFDTRQAQDSLLKWAGADLDYHRFLEKTWKEHIFSLQGEIANPKEFWIHSLQDGVFDVSSSNVTWNATDWIYNDALADISQPGENLDLVLYETVALGDGRNANNPWLQELPDPVSKACWDNYLNVSPSFAEKNGLQNEDVVEVAGLKVPVFVQPGQAEGTVSLALGYGRDNTGKVANNVGVNAWPLVTLVDGAQQLCIEDVSVKKTGKKHSLALTQTYHSMEGRPIVRETSLEAYLKNPGSGNESHEEAERNKVSLYNEVKFDGHHWGMAIDLNACTSCGACIIACQAENNIPVIGKEEVKNRRIMHWIRIDRYYSDEPDQPMVLNQPVMCQHCDNAPCENVCPVSATMHSNEGLNQIAYNRCIGTKYCINNCPYRVRRFNWYKYVDNDKFDYNQNSDLGRLVLNPDVVVRERGVVEKCTFCTQRIQEKKLEAKLENRPLRDGEIQPACVQTCPSEALVFGDLNDPESKVSRMFESERNYHLLEELHTLPSVGYLTKVRNIKAEEINNAGHDKHA